MRKLVLAAALAASLPAHAGEFNIQNSNQGQPMLMFKGDIDEGDARRMSDILEQHIAKNTPIITVFLNSPGGLIKEGVMMSNMVRNYNLDTIVMDGEVCASACFVVFASGTKRLAGLGSYVGVHQAHSITGAASSEATRTMVRVSTQLGVSPTIIQRMKTTAPQDVAWLTKDELQESGVQVWSPETKGADGSTPKISVASNSDVRFTPEKNKEWTNYVDSAVRASVRQSNNGKPAVSERCHSDYCSRTLFYQDKLGNAVIAQEIYDKTWANLTQRVVCRSSGWEAKNRSCTNFDTGETWWEVFKNNQWVLN